MKNLKHILGLIAFLAIGNLTFAQIQIGSIKGKILDRDSSEIIGAYVWVESNGNKITTVTDYNGKFHLSGIDAGYYDLIISYTGDTNNIAVNLKPDQVYMINNYVFRRLTEEVVVERKINPIKIEAGEELIKLGKVKNGKPVVVRSVSQAELDTDTNVLAHARYLEYHCLIEMRSDLKFKIMSKGDWWPKNPGETYGSLGYHYIKTSAPKEPVISNWHVLIYGSGILYNLINSSTNKEFSYPLIGVGTGVTFFNALDFNISVGLPLLENGGFTAMKKNAFIGFGFDIPIGEYLKEVGKKRKERKLRKQLTAKK